MEMEVEVEVDVEVEVVRGEDKRPFRWVAVVEWESSTHVPALCCISGPRPSCPCMLDPQTRIRSLKTHEVTPDAARARIGVAVAVAVRRVGRAGVGVGVAVGEHWPSVLRPQA